MKKLALVSYATKGSVKKIGDDFYIVENFEETQTKYVKEDDMCCEDILGLVMGGGDKKIQFRSISLRKLGADEVEKIRKQNLIFNFCGCSLTLQQIQKELTDRYFDIGVMDREFSKALIAQAAYDRA